MLRPKGLPKTGGRRKGSINRPVSTPSAAQRTHEIINAAIAAQQTPLEYMLAVLRDPTVDYHRRDEMAKAAAPYMHPRLTAITSRDGTDVPQNQLPSGEYSLWARQQICEAFGMPPPTIEHKAG